MKLIQKYIIETLESTDKYVKAEQFFDKFGIAPRELRYEISELRSKYGYIIESGSYGYRMAKTQQDAERCIAKLRKQAMTTLDIVCAMERNKVRLPR